MMNVNVHAVFIVYSSQVLERVEELAHVLIDLKRLYRACCLRALRVAIAHLNGASERSVAAQRALFET
jgi:hypothetical protein